jgi:outer membrane protein OmpA-like peptidoglycan-associated protein
LSSCDSGNVEQVFNSEKRVLQNKLNKERVLRVGLQAYIDSILDKDTILVMHRMEHYAETLFKQKATPAVPKTGASAAEKKTTASVALQNLENQLAGWAQKLPPLDWKLEELGTERLSLKVSDQALFNEKTSTLHAGGKRKITELSQQLQKNPNSQIYLYIEGHVDSLSQGTTDTWHQAWERAKNVGEAMIEAGFPASRLSLGSHGATAPVATNTTEAGRYLNRRTLLILYVK